MSIHTEFLGVAVVTGAGSGIGAAVARAFAVAGCANLALCDIDTQGLQSTHEMIVKDTSGPVPTIATYVCDVSDPSSVTSTFAQILSNFGHVDYAVNCAGLPTNMKPSTECSVEDFDRINGVNLRGLWLCSREELKVMKEQALSSEFHSNIPEARAQRGAIVNIASGSAIVGVPNSPAYAASKAGVVSLTRADAIDYSPHRIRVNAVLPGIVDTPMLSGTVGDVKAFEAMAAPMIPMRRLAQAEEIADAVLFLCSHRASYVQGHAMVVDGGYTTM